MTNKPRTKEECFAMLDEMLNEAEKKAIIETENSIEFHFSLGLWIRNNWIYGRNSEDIKALCKAFSIDDPFPDADELSYKIIETYSKFLKKKQK